MEAALVRLWFVFGPCWFISFGVFVLHRVAMAEQLASKNSKLSFQIENGELIANGEMI